MTSRFEVEAGWVVQVHPVHGRRRLIRADGAGQLVCVGEVAGSLLVFDHWSCMGYKDGSLDVLDPDTLEMRFRMELDLDAACPVGLWGEELFVECETRFGQSEWRAWRLSDWQEVAAPPVRDEEVRRLEKVLTCKVDLPRVPPAESRKPHRHITERRKR